MDERSGTLKRVVGPGGLIAFRTRLLRESDPESESGRWVRWFFADRAGRAISPLSPVDVPEFRRRLALLDTPEEDPIHETLLALAPMNPSGLARMGRDLVCSHTAHHVPDVERAERLTKLAVRAAPGLGGSVVGARGGASCCGRA